MKCRKCGKQVSEYAKICPHCKYKVSIEDKMTSKYIHKINGTSRSAEKLGQKSLKKVMIAIGGAAVLLIGVSIFAYSRIHNKMAVSEDTIFYVSDNALIARDLATGQQETLAEEFTTFENNNNSNTIENTIFSYNAENHKLYYASGFKNNVDMVYDIYEADADDLSTDPVCIAKEVYLASWDKLGNLYYATTDKKECYCYRNGESVAIPVSCVSEFIFSDNLDTIIAVSYKTEEIGLSINDCMEQDLDKAVTLINEVTLTTKELETVKNPFVIDEEGGQIYYLDEMNLYDYDLKLLTDNLISESADKFIYVDNEPDKGLYYLTHRVTVYNWTDYIENPYEESDIKISKSESLQEKETKEEESARIERMKVMDSVRAYQFKVREATLYKYVENKSEEVPINIGDLRCANQKVSEFPEYYKSCGFTGKIHIDDLIDMNLSSITITDYLTPDDGTGNDISTLYSWGMHGVNFDIGMDVIEEIEETYETEGYYYIESNTLYTYRNGEEFINDVTDEESIYDELLEVAKVDLDEHSYYIKLDNGFTLMKEDKDGSSEQVYESIEGYRIVKDGEYLVIRYEGDEKTLIYLNGNDETEIATEVTGIFGENSWCYDLGK